MDIILVTIIFFLYEFYYGELWFAELEITQQTHLLTMMRAHEASAQLCEIIQNETDIEKKEIEWFLTWWFDSKVIFFFSKRFSNQILMHRKHIVSQSAS